MNPSPHQQHNNLHPEIEGEPTVLTRRMAMAFAAGLLVEDTRFYDGPGREAQVLPFICARFEWPLSLALRTRIGLPAEALARGVHAAQVTRFHRAFVIGETIKTSCRIEGIRESRAGLVMTVTYLTRSSARGEPITTSQATVIYRGVAAPPGLRLVDQPDEDLLQRLGADRGVSKVLDNPPYLAHVYTEGADIYNPIHTERQVAHAAGLDDILVHGTAMWALAGIAVAGAVAGGDVDRLRRHAVRFSAPVWPGHPVAIMMDSSAEETRWTIRDVGNDQRLLMGASTI